MGALGPQRNRGEPELSAFLTHLCDPSGEADQASRSAPAPAVLWFRLGRGTRLSDPGITTSRRQLRQRGGRRAAAGHGGVFCRALSFSRDPWVPVSFALSRPECPFDRAGQSQACEQSWGSRTTLSALASSTDRLSGLGSRLLTSFCAFRSRRRARRKGCWRSRRQRKNCPALRRLSWILGDSQSQRMILTASCLAPPTAPSCGCSTWPSTCRPRKSRRPGPWLRGLSRPFPSGLGLALCLGRGWLLTGRCLPALQALSPADRFLLRRPTADWLAAISTRGFSGFGS